MLAITVGVAQSNFSRRKITLHYAAGPTMQSPFHPSGGGYWAGVGCVAIGELTGFSGPDNIVATLRGNVAPAVLFALNKPLGVTAGGLAIIYDLQIMLKARAACTRRDQRAITMTKTDPHSHGDTHRPNCIVRNRLTAYSALVYSMGSLWGAVGELHKPDPIMTSLLQRTLGIRVRHDYPAVFLLASQVRPRAALAWYCVVVRCYLRRADAHSEPCSPSNRNYQGNLDVSRGYSLPYLAFFLSFQCTGKLLWRAKGRGD